MLQNEAYCMPTNHCDAINIDAIVCHFWNVESWELCRWTIDNNAQVDIMDGRVFEYLQKKCTNIAQINCNSCKAID